MSWTRQEHEATKTRYQAALEEMAAGSVAGLVQVARLLPDALAEIERGWAEIERYEESEGAWHEATGANGAEDALGIMRTLRARLDRLTALLREARLRLAPLPRALTPEDHEPDTLPARIAAETGPTK